MMKIVEKNEGTKSPYSLTDSKLTLNDELTLDMSKYERDFPVHLDVCRNAYGMLTMGLSSNYVAQIDIPARSYTLQDNGVDVNGIQQQIKVPVAFSHDNATLTLWEVNAE
jgi:hypothetical protein